MRQSRANGRQRYDVAVVGAGVVGANIARELGKYKLDVVVLESEKDVCQGASKANSGICHGGYDAKHGTLKSKLSRRGNQMFDELASQLNFGFKRIGSLVLAFTDEDLGCLGKLLHNGRLNGVDDLELIDGERARQMEPHLSVGVKGALFCPSAGVVSPYEFTLSLIENAISNGVDVKVGFRVSRIEVLHELKTKQRVYRLENDTGDFVDALAIINCAGVYADTIAEMVSGAGNAGFSITPRKGQYILLGSEQGHMASRVIFQTPTVRWGKGVLVSPTVHGQLLIGPSAAEQLSRQDKGTDELELAYIAWAARRSVPHIDTRLSITSFAGLRARSNLNDFIIQQAPYAKHFINVVGIESPGLTSSPAIARMVVDILKCETELTLEANSNFSPHHRHPVLGWKKQGTIVCQCEKITDTEIERAIDQAGIPITCTDSIKWRTRAGMGRCQGARCRPYVAEIIAKRLGNETTFQDVPKQVSSLTPQRVPRKMLSRL
mmetsp:Transcript_30233/g.48085  ORF Transcript_30233/g.48085 Transcript_30233/m.48085 type:complete len:493 (-) Transcript_30233:2252-3730(-)